MIRKGSIVKYVVPKLGLHGEGVVTSVSENGRCFVKDKDSILMVVLRVENVEEVV